MNLATLPVVNRIALDNSVTTTTGRCARLGFYQYWLNRSPEGKSWPIALGLAYHTYREVLEEAFAEGSFPETAHQIAMARALLDWEDPPIGHKHDWYTYDRVVKTLEEGYRVWTKEKSDGRIKVLFSEQSFELEIPDCFMPDGTPEVYGGRIDQIIEWNGALWVRDFKTTSRMGSGFQDRFDPNNQLTGYVWAAGLLSGGRKVDGAIVEVPYNTKTKGPEIHQFLSTRSTGQIDQFLASQRMERRIIRMMEEATPELGMLAWPMRTAACDDYGGCFFRNACRQDNPRAIERWLSLNTVESTWDFHNPEGEAGLPE